MAINTVDVHAPIVKANTEFAVEFYLQQMKANSGNILLSPVCISAALALCNLGARGDTSNEMAEAMHIRDIDNIHGRFGEFLATLNNSSGAESAYQLKTANKLFGAERYNFLEEYLADSLKYFGADLERLNFADELKSRNVINKWVEDKTSGKIKDIIPPGVLYEFTKLVLVNAIYFKGNWDKKFEVRATRKGEFKVNETEWKVVDMMHQQDRFPFGFDRESGCEILALPYVKEELSMFIVLPTRKGGLAEVERRLSVEFLDRLTKSVGVRKTNVMVSLPKFKFEKTVELNDVLEAMGIRKLFTEGVADLSGMDGTRELYVSRGIHKAFIEVNEEGTEAAAATGIMVDSYSMPPEFRADRPFMFFIRDNRTMAFLFLGQVTDPTS
ncbi:leukocyte elastase inhibitor-like isoform X2 [Tubulanus polymorphus]